MILQRVNRERIPKSLSFEAVWTVMDCGREGTRSPHFHKVKPGLMSGETGAGRCWEDAAVGSHGGSTVLLTQVLKRD